MKLTPIITALALIYPFAASAQSLPDTHELVWNPSGKTPASSYRPRNKSVCTATSDHHRAGKGQLQPQKACPAVAKKASPPPAAELAAD